MADTPAVAGLTPQQFDAKFSVDFFQRTLFKPEIGTSENAIIQVKRDLSGKPGDSVNYSLVNSMTGAGVTGTATLEGNEEEVKTRSQKVSVIKRRNAFRVAEQDEAYSAISLRKAGKVTLMNWAEENTIGRVVGAMTSIDGVAYGTATATQKNTWLVNNSDRVLFGATNSNNTAVHATSLANVDAVGDKMTSDIGGVLKRAAQTALPRIRPVRSASSGREYFTCYLHPWSFRDLAADPKIVAAQTGVGLRMQNEKLFKGGDIEWDGVIYKRLDSAPLYTGVGASGADVAPVIFCGAQAVGWAVRRDWWSTDEEFDYGDKKGVAMNAFDGFEKLRFGTDATVETDIPKDHGIVTGYVAAVADA